MDSYTSNPTLAEFINPEHSKLDYPTFDFDAPHHKRITFCLNQTTPMAVRELATALELTRPQMQNLMAEVGWATKPTKQSQWRAKKGFTHYFVFDRKTGYILSPQGMASIAATLHKRLSRPNPTPISANSRPLRADWRAFLPPDLLPELEKLADDQTANFYLLPKLLNYMHSYEELQRGLDQFNDTPSLPLPLDELARTVKVPTHLQRDIWPEFLSQYIRTTNSGRTKEPRPGYESWFHLNDGRISQVMPHGVYKLAFAWEKYRARLAPRQDTAPQTAVYATKPTPPIAAPAPKTAPPQDLNTPVFNGSSYDGDLTYRSPPPDDLKVEGNDLSIYGTAADKLKYIDPNDPDDLGAF